MTEESGNLKYDYTAAGRVMDKKAELDAKFFLLTQGDLETNKQ